VAQSNRQLASSLLDAVYATAQHPPTNDSVGSHPEDAESRLVLSYLGFWFEDGTRSVHASFTNLAYGMSRAHELWSSRRIVGTFIFWAGRSVVSYVLCVSRMPDLVESDVNGPWRHGYGSEARTGGADRSFLFFACRLSISRGVSHSAPRLNVALITRGATRRSYLGRGPTGRRVHRRFQCMTRASVSVPADMVRLIPPRVVHSHR